MTHETVCILGMSYCGSTMLSGLMYNVPGAFSVGEAHWLLDRDSVPNMKTCSHCGDECSVLGKKKDWAAVKPHDLYSTIAKVSGCKVLVTSDKAKWTIERYVPHGVAKAVVLFRRPEAMLASGRRHHAGWDDSMGSLYADWYGGLLHWSSGWFRQRVVVEYERLAADPQKQLERICDRLGLPAPQSPFVYPPDVWHNVGGNAHAWNWGNDVATIALDDRWRVEVTAAEAQGLRRHVACQDIWKRLRGLAIA